MEFVKIILLTLVRDKKSFKSGNNKNEIYIWTITGVI